MVDVVSVLSVVSVCSSGVGVLVTLSVESVFVSAVRGGATKGKREAEARFAFGASTASSHRAYFTFFDSPCGACSFLISQSACLLLRKLLEYCFIRAASFMSTT